mmetsp:Transcript_61375/g.171764  ORF Transcript_61375/g.171764 Transcript_61375/m.171764 type:complete len:252 (-) Transcript_61375:1117-1872(-)
MNLTRPSSHPSKLWGSREVVHHPASARSQASALHGHFGRGTPVADPGAEPCPEAVHAGLAQLHGERLGDILGRASVDEGGEELSQGGVRERRRRASSAQGRAGVLGDPHGLHDEAALGEAEDERAVGVPVRAVEARPRLHLIEELQGALWRAVVHASADEARGQPGVDGPRPMLRHPPATRSLAGSKRPADNLDRPLQLPPFAPHLDEQGSGEARAPDAIVVHLLEHHRGEVPQLVCDAPAQNCVVENRVR